MQATDKTAGQKVDRQPATYAEEMAAEREKLNGRPYCKAVRDILPDLTPWQVRNAVNGRTENPLVLSALRIVRHKLDASKQNAEARLLAASQDLRAVA